MARFTVTVEADDDPAGSKMTIRLEASSAGARVLEVAIVAGEGGSVSSEAFPPVSLERLVSAFTAPSGTFHAANGGPPVRPKARPANAKSERSYRRMPDPAELLSAYQNADSVTGLARRYGVPRHTMNGWLSRLRRMGLLASR
ncbi:hypothetical protein [Jidongwangia harbinensis]|uniref:hypothetical protein n=1 Tax=Jidongwangia harbinensis TaxID=2878561 RepID=UPI001CD98CEB|nr:hypothetical protein [Jidongwangia harbinensis]MCA2218762.1 hypothetical protein [Jidongwangia harbinensis]